MTKLREKARGQVKQAVGQIVGDDQLVLEGKKQQSHAEPASDPSDQRGSKKEEPNDKSRMQKASKIDVNKPRRSRPATRPGARVPSWTDRDPARKRNP